MKKIAVILFLSCILCVRLEAQDTTLFVPKSDQPVQSLTNYLRLLEDKNNSFTIQQILSGQAGNFIPLNSFGKIDPHKTWWVKLDLVPPFTSDNFYIGLPQLELSGISRGNDKVDAWITYNRNIVGHFETGILLPASKRVIARPINHNLFPISLKDKQQLTVYLRIQRIVNFETLQLGFALQHKDVIESVAKRLDRLAWFYGGIMFILFMFGLVFFLITKQGSFAWFFTIAAVLYLHMQLLEPENGLTSLLFPEHPVYQFYLFQILTSSFAILILQFIRSFSDTKKLLPRWDKIILSVMIYIGVVGLLSLIFLSTNPAITIPDFVFLLVFLAIIVIGARLMMTKNLYARWTGFALLWLFLFQFLGILWNANVLPRQIPNPWAIAQIGMMIILFFALGYRFKQSAREKAEAAKALEMDIIKSRFFANISHEFRTPLTLMLGPLKQIEENSMDSSKQKKYIHIMRRNGDRLLQLINQLLDLSKLESGKMDLNLSKTDITSLVKTIASSFDSLAEEKQVNYHLHFPEETIIGYTDKDKLEKVIVNLLSNAFRFTAKNGTVSFSVEQDEKRLRFTIQDNGVGLPKEQLNKIFDRFYQVEGTTGGTGIGLSLVKELIQIHKGQISVSSEMGRGSSFRVSIPISAESYSASELTSSSGQIVEFTNNIYNKSSAEELETEEEGVPDSSLPLVLIAEDNADLQHYIGDILRNHFNVLIVSNGKTGFEMAKERIPDCVISDVMMPEMDGIEFCKRLKKEPATNHIPIILLTAKAGVGSRIEGLKTGADDYLVKPFDGPELIIRIQNLIEQRKQLRDRYSKQVISLHPDEINSPSIEQEFIQSVRRVIDENIDNELFGVAELANDIHLSRSQLHRKLKALTGQAPNELIRNYRLERAFQLLTKESGTVTEIAFQTGFSSPAYFSKCFSDRYGYAPTELKKKQF